MLVRKIPHARMKAFCKPLGFVNRWLWVPFLPPAPIATCLFRALRSRMKPIMLIALSSLAAPIEVFAHEVFAQQQDASTPKFGRTNAVDSHRFDGTWDVTVSCADTRDGGQLVKGYTFRVLAEVKDGRLRGEHGTEGSPGWLRLDGIVKADGSADINAKGLTGDPDYTVGHVAK